MVEKSLHGVDRQTAAIARRKVQEGPVSGLYSKCVLQVRQEYSGVLTGQWQWVMSLHSQTSYQTEYVVVDSSNVQPHCLVEVLVHQSGYQVPGWRISEK